MSEEAWFALGRQAACGVVLVAAAIGWGEWALRAAGIDVRERGSGWRLSLGLLTLGFLFFLSALAGVFKLELVAWVAFVGVATSGWLLWRHLSGAGRAGVRTSDSHFSTQLALTAVGAALLLWLTLYPPHAFDETVYHLPIAESLAEHGAVRWLDNLRVPVFPQIAEALAGGLWLFGGAEATHLLQAMAFAAILSLVATQREAAGSAAGRLAAAALVGSPLLVYQATTLYVDLFLALAVAVAVLAAERSRAGPEAGRGWFIVAALAAGLAPAIKYLGVLGSVAAFALVVTTRRVPWRQRMTDAALFLALAAVVAAPTFLWLWVTTRNPVYPFLPGIFGPTGLEVFSSGTTAAQRAMEFLALPWNAFADRSLSGAQPPPSPWLWVALTAVAAGVALGAARVRAAIGAVAGAAAILTAGAFFLYLVAGAATAIDLRYLISAAPLLAVAFGRVLAQRLEPHSRRVVLAASLALALPGLAYAGFQIWRLGPLPLTAASREAFLERQHPGLRALREAERAAARLYVLGNERLVGLGRSVVYGDVAGRLPVREVAELLATPERLAPRLDLFGIEALVILRGAPVPGDTPRILARSPRFRRLYEDDQATVWRLSPPPPPPPPAASPSQ